MKFFILALCLVAYCSAENYFSSEYVDEINKKATTWVAGKNFPEDMPLEAFMRKLGAIMDETKTDEEIEELDDLEDGKYPENFDAREKWGGICPSVKEIRDQSDCGSCWAFGAATSITDRTCIASKGAFTKTLSATDLLSCCSECGDGCDGGYPPSAWQYWVDNGLPTGGEFGDKSSCRPYPFYKCEHHVPAGKYPACPEGEFPTPECKQECQAGYPKAYADDLYKGDKAFPIARNQYRKQLMQHGPFEVSFTVYTDFPHYKSGVYQPTTDKSLGGHAVRLLGWGVENGVKYWTVANSWNEDWGLNGTFKILRGKDTCDIESNGYGGYPKM